MDTFLQTTSRYRTLSANRGSTVAGKGPGRSSRVELGGLLHPCIRAVKRLVVALLVLAVCHAAQAAALPDEARARIEAAVPEKALAAPKPGRRLLIYEANVGYGGHPSAAYAREAFRLMGEKTGAFAVEASEDPEVFRAESLGRFDAVFFNNTVGNLFAAPELRENLVEFVLNGGGLLGVHGTSVAFTRWPGAHEDWREFGLMLGGRGANHRDSDERVFVKLDDRSHPLNAVFGGDGFEYRDEFFRVHDPYSRERVRVLLSFDTEKTDMNQGMARGQCVRADNDYAIAWVRSYGRGRTFYCTIAHNPYVFWDARMLEFYLGALQFALGDLEAPTVASSRLTQAMRAQEQLGWRVLIEVPFDQQTDLGAVLRATGRLGVAYAGLRGLPTPGGTPFGLPTDEAFSTLRQEADAAGLHLLCHRLPHPLTEPDEFRQARQLARKLGLEVLIAEPSPTQLSEVDQWLRQSGVSLAIPCGPGASASAYRGVESFMATVGRRSPFLGASLDVDACQQQGIDPGQVIRQLAGRLKVIRLEAWAETPPVWLQEVHRQGLKPMLLLAGADGSSSPAVLTHVLESLNAATVRFARSSSDKSHP